MKYISIILLVISLTSCDKEERCPDEIRIPYWIHPVKNVYKVGDTLEIISKFSNNIRDVDGDLFHFENNEWMLNFEIIPLDTLVTKSLTSIYFKILNLGEYDIKHYESDLADSYDGKYEHVGDSLKFMIRGVLIKPGIIRTGCGVGSGPPKEANSACKQGWFYNPPFTILMNNGVDHNLDLTYEIIDSTGGAYIRNNPLAFNKSGCYLMKVVP